MQLLSWLRQRLTCRPPSRRAPARKPTPRFRPRLELLEARDVPTKVTPTPTPTHTGFSLSGSYGVSTGPQAMVTADVNHDGALDLITADVGHATGTGGVSVQLGQKSKQGTPTGTFGAADPVRDISERLTARRGGAVLFCTRGDRGGGAPRRLTSSVPI